MIFVGFTFSNRIWPFSVPFVRFLFSLYHHVMCLCLLHFEIFGVYVSSCRSPRHRFFQTQWRIERDESVCHYRAPSHANWAHNTFIRSPHRIWFYLLACLMFLLTCVCVWVWVFASRHYKYPLFRLIQRFHCRLEADIKWKEKVKAARESSSFE